jgi:hypothetical protein
VIAGILVDDKSRPKKQQHTAKRIFERLRDEYGFLLNPHAALAARHFPSA